MTEGPGPDDTVPFASEPDAPEPATSASEPEPNPHAPELETPDAPAPDAPAPDAPATPAPDANPDAPALEPGEPPAAPVTPAIPPPSVETTRRLLGASFDLLQRTSDDMRQASFYIGLVTLGTVGPFAIGSFAIEVVSIHRPAARWRTCSTVASAACPACS